MRLELPLAGVGSRILAVVIDTLVLLVLIAVWWVAGLAVSRLTRIAGLGFGWVVALLMLGSFLLQWGYFAAFELATGGRTPGKMALGLRVVTRHGGRAGVAAVLLRNLLRTLDLLIGVPVMAIDRRSRRVGDVVAGTLVAHEQLVPEGAEVALGRIPAGWGGREVAVVEGFLRRAPLLEPGRAEPLARQILDWLAAQDPSLAATEAERAMPVAALRQRLAVEQG